MNANQLRKAIRELGYRVFVVRDQDGHEYTVKTMYHRNTVYSGWSPGTMTDALEAAYGALKRKLEETNES